MLLKIKTFTITCLLFGGVLFQLAAQPGAGCLECLDAPFEPVCVADAEGNVIPFPNACFAECEGFSADDFVVCDTIGGPIDPPGGFDCQECLDAPFEPVCVADAEGNVIPFPNACFAECEGYTSDDFVVCDTIGTCDPPGGFQCEECLDAPFEPVCVADADGNVIPFPNACFAECEGFSADDFVVCDSTIFGGDDCVCTEEFEPVCVADADGNIIPFPNACYAECEGYTADDFVDCGDVIGGGFDCQECLDAPFEPVCVADAEGNVIPFPNACFAECEGYTSDDFVVCDSTIFGGDDCVCTEEFEPVCVADADGNIIPFPNACYAECEGYTADDFVDCGDVGGGFECMECLDAPFEPVCVADADGNVIPFPNACFAECEGYTSDDFVVCDSTVFGPCDPPTGGFECEECLDAPFELVCIASNDGGIIPFPNLCFAECAGFTEDDVVECDGLANINDDFLQPQVVEMAQATKNIPFVLLQNPVTHNLRVGFDGAGSEINEGTFFVLNLNGKVLLQQKVEVTKGSNQYEINVSDLQPGIYMVSFKTAKGVQTLKFVK
ncbi:MAG TPA: T9SS type A sorting domain-containing protein [Bacteroidetes bacterium]|nr:T9SS type A sorting domain-containing protein [Bacteroidota bacterium]